MPATNNGDELAVEQKGRLLGEEDLGPELPLPEQGRSTSGECVGGGRPLNLFHFPYGDGIKVE